MPTNTAPDDTLDHRHHLGTDEAASLAVAAGALAEVDGDGASS